MPGYSSVEQQEVDKLRRDALVGDAVQVAGKLRALAAEHEVQELVVITWAHDPAVRQRSYELLAKEFF